MATEIKRLRPESIRTTGASANDVLVVSGGQTAFVNELFVSGLNIGTSSSIAGTKLQVVGDIEISGSIFQSGDLFSASDTGLAANLVTTGQSLLSDISTVSGLITSNDSEIAALQTATGSLQTQVTANDGDISTNAGNISTNTSNISTNTSNISTNTSNISTNTSNISTNASNLVTTGQTLQSQITSNDSDISTNAGNISTNASNLVTTGQTLQTQITSNDGDITSLTSNLVTTGQTLQAQVTSNDSDISALQTATGTLNSTTVKTTTNQTIAGDKTFTDLVTINNLTVTGTETIVSTANLNVKDNIILINSGEAGAGISLVSGGLEIDRGSATNANILFNDSTDQFELNFPIATEGNLVATAPNLISTGQTLQTQITSNDSDISTLTSNLTSTGSTLDAKIDTLSGIVALDSETGDHVTTSMTGGFATKTIHESFSQGLNVGTSATLGSRKLHVVGDVEISGTIFQSGSKFEGGGGGGGGGAGGVGDLTSDVYTGDGITTGYDLSIAPTGVNSVLVSVGGIIQTPTTNYTITGSSLNFSSPPPTGTEIEIRNLNYAAGYVTTAVTNTLDAKIDTLSGVVALDSETGAFGNMSPTSINSNLIPDGSGTRSLGSAANPWDDLFVSSGTINIGGKTISLTESGISFNSDISIDGTIFQSGAVFEGGGGGGGSSTFLGLTDTPGSFTASKYLSVNSAGNAVEMVDAIQSGFARIDQGYFTGFSLAGAATGIVQNASGSVAGLDLADNKWDVSIIEETDVDYISGDTSWTGVVLLMPFDGVDGATTWVDESDANHTSDFSYNGNVIDTAQSKWGGTSLYFDGNDYLDVTQSSYTGGDFDFDTGDFTIETWIRFTSTHINNYNIIWNATGPSTPDSKFIRLTYDGRGSTDTWSIYCKTGSDFTYQDTSLAADTWYHIAVSRTSGVIKFFKDGTQLGSDLNNANAMGFYGGMRIGKMYHTWTPYNFGGWMDDFRVTKGVGRYTSNFTAPTEALETQGGVNIVETKYISQIGGWDDTDVDYGIKKISNSELSVKKMGADVTSRPIDRLYVNVQKLGAIGQGVGFNQIFTGDGTTTNYLLTDSVPSTQDLLVSVQGLIQTPNIDYTLAGNTGVSFATGVRSGDEISLRYLALGPSGATGPSGAGGGINYSQDIFTGNGVVSGFSMGRTVSNILETTVFVNGLAQISDVNYFVNGTGLTFTSGDIVSGDLVMVRHVY